MSAATGRAHAVEYALRFPALDQAVAHGTVGPVESLDFLLHASPDGIAQHQTPGVETKPPALLRFPDVVSPKIERVGPWSGIFTLLPWPRYHRDVTITVALSCSSRSAGARSGARLYSRLLRVLDETTAIVMVA